MKTTLNAEGQLGIPKEILDTDRLTTGDSFDLERLSPGHYLLAKNPTNGPVSVHLAGDGLPVIRVSNGVINSQVVKSIESQTS